MHFANIHDGFRGHEGVWTFRKAVIISLMFFVPIATWSCGRLAAPNQKPTPPKSVIMKLGGDDCEFYFGAVEAALKKTQRGPECRP